MKCLRLLLIALVIGFSTNSSAVTVNGVPSCGKWVKDRVEPDSWSALMDYSWLNGYLSGVAEITDVDFLKSTDVESLHLWMDKYCNDHPLNHINDGGYELSKALRKRKP